VNAAARRWAGKLGVDPYSTNPLLAQALLDVARVDAAGRVAAKIAMPIPPIVGMTAKVGELVWGKDPEELRKLNESRLRDLGAADDVADALIRRSDAFTLTYQTRLIAALHAVRATGSEVLASVASEASNEREALYYVEAAEMLQRLHAATPVRRVLAQPRVFLADLADDRVAALLPLDWLRWSENLQSGAAEIAAWARNQLPDRQLELHLTGRVSKRAKQGLREMGWAVRELEAQ
jgi:hypothetical protein